MSASLKNESNQLLNKRVFLLHTINNSPQAAFFIFSSFLLKQKQEKIQYLINRFNQTILIQLQIHFILLLKYLFGLVIWLL